jgi:hypothetical protein
MKNPESSKIYDLADYSVTAMNDFDWLLINTNVLYNIFPPP